MAALEAEAGAAAGRRVGGLSLWLWAPQRADVLGARRLAVAATSSSSTICCDQRRSCCSRGRWGGWLAAPRQDGPAPTPTLSLPLAPPPPPPARRQQRT